MTQSVFATLAPQFAPSPAPVAQWIEQRFPKPQVAVSITAGGTSKIKVSTDTRKSVLPFTEQLVNIDSRIMTILQSLYHYCHPQFPRFRY